MLQLRTFQRGGIHPPEQKLSARAPIIIDRVPEVLRIPVNQHIGRPLTIVVKKGDVVKRGDLLAKSTGFISSNIHAPVDGKIVKIGRFPLLGGAVREVIELKPELPGQPYEEVLARDPVFQVKIDALEPSEIRQRIAEAGIIGMGGAGFPTHVKLSPPESKPIDAVIINGAECEPYITADHRIMVERTADIVQGIKILQRLFPQASVYIGIENNKPDALTAFDQLLKHEGGIFVVPLKSRYPQGGEKQLIKAVVRREVPSKGLPMDVGVVVQNVATVLAIRNLFFRNRPLMERVVTVSGNIVPQPGNILLPVGTPVQHVIQKFNIDSSKVRLFIAGGPMMGRMSYSFESPITKTTSALLFFDESVYKTRQENPCLRCGTCLRVCPMGLDVATCAQLIQTNHLNEKAKNDILDCIECGSCTFVCPADRRLVQWMRLGKSMIRREN